MKLYFVGVATLALMLMNASVRAEDRIEGTAKRKPTGGEALQVDEKGRATLYQIPESLRSTFSKENMEKLGKLSKAERAKKLEEPLRIIEDKGKVIERFQIDERGNSTAACCWRGWGWGCGWGCGWTSCCTTWIWHVPTCCNWGCGFGGGCWGGNQWAFNSGGW
jgi:hypothetical protein